MAGDLLTRGMNGGGAAWNGPGYIAGESPGLLTVNSVPGARAIFVIERISKVVAGATFSAPDGSYRIDGLDPNQEFDVIARDWTITYNDVIVSRVKPQPY